MMTVTLLVRREMAPEIENFRARTSMVGRSYDERVGNCCSALAFWLSSFSFRALGFPYEGLG